MKASRFKTGRTVILIFVAAFILQAALAFRLWDYQKGWPNVPPAPSAVGLSSFHLGDRQLAYRTTNLMLQNLGNLGGRAEKFEEYNYQYLKDWFFVADEMDERSHYTPRLAAFYFGASTDNEDLRPVVDYLAVRGRVDGNENWRWLGQAAFRARLDLEDFEYAAELAEDLSNMWEPGRPFWMKHMPAFVMIDQGQREQAMEMMMNMFIHEAETMPAGDVDFMIGYFCREMLEPIERANYDICSNVEYFD